MFAVESLIEAFMEPKQLVSASLRKRRKTEELRKLHQTLSKDDKKPKHPLKLNPKTLNPSRRSRSRAAKMKDAPLRQVASLSRGPWQLPTRFRTHPGFGVPCLNTSFGPYNLKEWASGLNPFQKRGLRSDILSLTCLNRVVAFDKGFRV